MPESLRIDTATIPFSWSERREYEFRRCRRSSFLHYFAAYGGHDPDAPATTRRLHRLRQLQSRRGYLRQLLAQTLRDYFYRPYGGEEEEDTRIPAATLPGGGTHLKQLALRLFYRDRQSMLWNESEHDHGKVCLLDFHTAPENGPTLFRELEDELRRQLGLPIWDGLLAELDAIPMHNRLPLPLSLATHFNELTLYGAPVLLFRQGSRFIFLELGTLPQSGDGAAGPLIHRFYALENLKIRPDMVSSWYLDTVSGECADILPEISIALDRILAGADAMKSGLRPDGTAVEEDFSENPEACGGCRFRSYCRS